MKISVLAENTACAPEIIAEHGLSLLIETNRHRILFDMGQTDAFARNAAVLGLDLQTVDLAVLSHGHYDHGGGLPFFLQMNDHAPVYVSRCAFEPHYHGPEKYIGLDPCLLHHPRLIPVGDDLTLDDNLSLHSCNHQIPSVPVESFGLSTLIRGTLIPDDFRHEQYLLIRDGARKIIFTGCSHKGILNLVRWFQPDVLVGGFHFMKLDPAVSSHRARLEEAGRALMEVPTQYYTCHCTGLAQYDLLKPIMGSRLDYLSAGRVINL